MFRWKILPKSIFTLLVLVCPLNPDGLFAGKDFPQAYFKVKDCPHHPGCPALILEDETIMDYDRRQPVFRRHRILKIFTQEGVQDHSDVSAMGMKREIDVQNMKGRTVLPDGSEQRLDSANITVKTFREGKKTYLAKSATLPGVVPGAIVEWSFDIEMEADNYSLFDIWAIQEDLLVWKSRYVLKQPPGLDITWVQTGSETVDVDIEETDRKTTVFTARRVPPIPEEPFGPHPEAIQSRIYFYPEILKTHWLGLIATIFARQSGEFIEASPAITRTVERLTDASDPDLERARSLYRFVQSEIGTEDERLTQTRRSRIEEAKTANTVLNRKYGDEFERTLLYLALAKEADLEPALLLISSRFNGPLDRMVPDFEVFDSFAAAVKIRGRWKTVDPATPFCPFGLVSQEKESYAQNGILVTPDKEAKIEGLFAGPFFRPKFSPFTFVQVKVTPAKQNVTSREATVSLDARGHAEIELTESGTGHAGIALRNLYEPLEAPERRDTLEEEIKKIFPKAELLEATFENLSFSEEPPVINCRFRVDGLASPVGTRLAFHPSLFHSESPNPFTAETRRTSANFPFASGNITKILIRIPEGFRIDGLPEPVVIAEPPFTMALSYFTSGEGFRVNRRVEIDIADWPAEEYLRLQSFYQKIWEADRHVVAVSRESEGKEPSRSLPAPSGAD